MTIPWLEAVCEQDSPRIPLVEHPWRMPDGSLVATDGKIIVCVHGQEADYPVLEEPKLAAVRGLLYAPLTRLGTLPMADFRAFIDPACATCGDMGQLACKRCDGYGMVVCTTCEHESNCPACHGSGKTSRCPKCKTNPPPDRHWNRPCRIGSQVYARDVLCCLPKELQGAVQVFESKREKDTILVLKGAGWQACVMPLLWVEGEVPVLEVKG